MRNILVISCLLLLFSCVPSKFTYFAPSNCHHEPALRQRSEKKVRVLAFGDSGTGNKDQQKVALRMKKVCGQRCDFAVMMGDNFYPTSVMNYHDPQFSTKFEAMYGSMGIKFFPSLGNHDYYRNGKGVSNPLAQVRYTHYSPSKKWCMPNLFYKFSHRNVSFFAIDTMILIREFFRFRTCKKAGKKDCSRVHYDWLAKELQFSKSQWNVVYGHHNINTYGLHRLDRNNLQAMRSWLKPLICKHASLYISGHDHDLQLLKQDCGVPLVVSGAAGKLRRTGKGPETLFSKSALGFNLLEFDKHEMKIIFHYLEGGKAKMFTRSYKAK